MKDMSDMATLKNYYRKRKQSVTARTAWKGDIVQLSTEFWVQISIYMVSIGSFAGVVLTRLKHLEKKQDKHNQLIERMVAVEQKAESAHERIDELREKWG